MNKLSIIRSEKGIAFPTVIFVVTLVALMTVTVSFMTQSQLANTEVMSDSTMAFNIAEAGLERLLSQYGTSYPTNITNINTVVSGYAAIALNGGQYTTSVMKDPNRAGNILITSAGTKKTLKRTIQVSIRGVPEAFKYGLISNSALLFQGQGNGYALVNGNTYSEGDINVQGNHIFMNTPTYNNATGNDIPNPNYDPQWTTFYTGSILPANNPAVTGATQKISPVTVSLPETDYAYYRNQANFTKQQVFVYTGLQSNWTVDQFNNYFKPTGAYTSAIVIMEKPVINLTGSGIITATILSGTTQDLKGDISINADYPAGVINFLPAIGLAMVAEKYDIRGTVNIGSKDVGAIVISTGVLTITGIKFKNTHAPSKVTFWGAVLLGETDDNTAYIELNGGTLNAGNMLYLNFTGSATKPLPAGWENWGTTTMVKDNWKES